VPFLDFFPLVGAALHALNQYAAAIDAYRAGLRIAPEDAGLKSGLMEVQKAQSAPPSDGRSVCCSPRLSLSLPLSLCLISRILGPPPVSLPQMSSW
jgi:hypothetical protein